MRLATLGFHEDTLVQAEVPLGWHHGPRKGILILDLMIAFGVNVAGVIARRGYPMLSQPGAPAFLAWVGAHGEIQGPRQVARIWRACTR